jgi:hypothetical protein
VDATLFLPFQKGANKHVRVNSMTTKTLTLDITQKEENITTTITIIKFVLHPQDMK